MYFYTPRLQVLFLQTVILQTGLLNLTNSIFVIHDTIHDDENIFKKSENRSHISVGEVPVWSLSVRHHLPHDHSVTPHITGGGELPVGNGLRGCPADRNLPALLTTWIHLRQIYHRL